ncbi:LOG family protein [Sphingomicrobium astaxanthinifaciens]|uniref:LOG family protein n=1 Tax=Sphingomicrobium astaxanthinifaciens TaxID=1227949 RepID=UPI001FCAD193|nr:LOG family protein [Sphingomicrobium astaxanthinifaciens]MCJ7421510.1 LOG family protein [Sphingomicrobium astaxanthinifaciens]
MSDKHTPRDPIFPSSKTDAAAAATIPSSPQTESEAYKLAFQDHALMLRDELRPVRLQLELLKPELLMQEAKIASTFVMYGSARVPEPSKAEQKLAAAKTDYDKKVAQRLVAKSKYYDEARKLARIASTFPVDEDGQRHFVVTSGGGPSYMEAANRGAHDEGKESIGLNITLPHEQLPNEYITPDLSFQFHYFALRKMHFLIRARAVAVFPGGYGTFDELFELLTLVQTGKVHPLPILVFGKEEFWDRVLDLEALALEGTISKGDLDLITWVETAEEAWAEVCKTYDACFHP